MNEIIVNLDRNSNEPLYMQLYKYIREEIKANNIKKVLNYLLFVISQIILISAKSQ